MNLCADCGSEHLGGPCGTTWLKRLRSVTLDPAATPSRTRVNYYDQSAVHEAFGEGAKERMYDETDGRGPAHRHPRTGQLVRRDRHTKEPVPVSPADVEFYTGSDTEG